MLERRTGASLPVALERLTIQPSPALEHRRQHRLGEVERRVHVHLEGDAPPLQRHLRRLRVHRRGRVVDEDVDRAAELLDGLGHDAGAVVAVGEVGRDHGDRVAVGAQPRRRSR